MNKLNEKLHTLIQWATRTNSVRAALLVGSLASGAETDELSDIDLSLFGHFDFIRDEHWLSAIGPYLLCIHDEFNWGETRIPTRLTIFEDLVKVDFSFHPLSLLEEMASSGQLNASYASGYRWLIDKEGLAAGFPAAGGQARTIHLPDEKTFRQCVDEFWFEAWHVAKYLRRHDRWAAWSRDHAMKKWLLQMLQWNAASYSDHPVTARQEGRQLDRWMPAEHRQELASCFSSLNRKEQIAALEHTAALFHRVGKDTAGRLQYEYNNTADAAISTFIVSTR